MSGSSDVLTVAASASSLEMAWTGIAMLGAACSVALIAHIWLSFRAVMAWIGEGRIVRWGPRHRFVLGFLAGSGLLLLVWLGFVALGGNAMTNLPPTTPDREAASERGAIILIFLELVLLAFQAILLAAWVSVGKPTLHPDRAPNSPVSLLFRAIDLGRELGHAVRNEAQGPVLFLDELANDPSLPADIRSRAAESLIAVERMVQHASSLHASIKALEKAP